MAESGEERLEGQSWGCLCPCSGEGLEEDKQVKLFLAPHIRKLAGGTAPAPSSWESERRLQHGDGAPLSL